MCHRTGLPQLLERCMILVAKKKKSCFRQVEMSFLFGRELIKLVFCGIIFEPTVSTQQTVDSENRRLVSEIPNLFRI